MATPWASTMCPRSPFESAGGIRSEDLVSVLAGEGAHRDVPHQRQHVDRQLLLVVPRGLLLPHVVGVTLRKIAGRPRQRDVAEGRARERRRHRGEPTSDEAVDGRADGEEALVVGAGGVAEDALREVRVVGRGELRRQRTSVLACAASSCEGGNGSAIALRRAPMRTRA